MSQQLTDAEKIRRLPWLLGGDTMNIIFVLLTFSGSVFVLYLNELGLNIGQIGIMLALVPFCGILAPIVAPISNHFGYKRVFVAMRGLRNLPMALLLFTPLVLHRYGQDGAFWWVAGIILAFAFMRVIGETGNFSWRKEIVPDAIRGKFAAINSMTTTIASIIIILVAGYVIEQSTGLQGFTLLIGIGVLFGALSVFSFARVPRESKSGMDGSDAQHWSGMRKALGSRAFLLFLLVLGLATIGSQLSISFIPLFMKEEVGLSDGIVVLLSMGTYVGALITSYFWGWAADRYSSKPVMQVSLILMLLLPIFWTLLPRHAPSSVALAMSIAFFAGVAMLAWQISWIRYLYVNAVPAKNRSSFLAIYFAWFSLVVGLAPLLAGRILTLSAGILAIQLGPVHIDSYTPLFVLNMLLILLTIVIIPRLRTDSNVTFRRFAGLFLRGNPVRAMRLLVAYNQSGNEMTRIVTAEQMGDTQSPLNALELIEALHDPNFNVRYEAVHAIGRMPAQPELTEALIEVLEGSEPELGMVTARALSRIGDPQAIPALRRALSSRYDLIAVNGARALAQLGDAESIPLIAEKMSIEPNQKLKVGYASALGKLGARDMLAELFPILCAAEATTERGELGLAIARLIGDEKYYLQHWQGFRDNYETASAQAVLGLKKVVIKAGHEELGELVESCSANCGAGDFQAGSGQLLQLLRATAGLQTDQTLREALLECDKALVDCDGARFDLMLLSLHSLDIAWSGVDGS